MRAPVVFLALSVSAAAVAAPQDTLETARRIAASGAVELALERVVRAQPAHAGAPSWAEWEALRIDLLGRLERHRDVLARVGMLPWSLAPEPMRAIRRTALRAAAALGNGPEIRAQAVRLLWAHDVSAKALREVRELIIESYLADGRGEAAFLAMLRFEQDYRPLERALVARFVEEFVDLGMARQAVVWLARLDDGSALKLRLRLEAGLIEPATALAQARTLAARVGGVDAWRAVAAAALKQGELRQRVEALERVVHGLEDAPRRAAARARELWQAYDALARAMANKHQLLSGDDAGWAEFAAQRLGPAPAVARAFFGHLARHAVAADVGHNAQLQLARSLREEKLGRAALRLFETAAADVAALAPEMRFVLGDIAASSGAPRLAFRYWQDLTPPDSVGGEWPFRFAAAALESGRPESAAEALRRELAGKSGLPPQLVRRAADAARALSEVGRSDDAAALYGLLLPLSEPAMRREIFFDLGRVSETGARWPDAADYYLRSALLADPKAPDALALQARLAGARALARAGYHGDARAQYEWLMKSTKDAVQIEMLRREADRLRR